MTHPSQWMEVRPEGLYCRPADLYIDPMKPVARALVTHGHADHARSGHETVYCTHGTAAIMAVRYGETHAKTVFPLEYGQVVNLSAQTRSAQTRPAQTRSAETRLYLVPAGHILGSAQAVLEHDGGRIVISGDYKRSPDPTCPPFQPTPCDVFVTEATFGLPVFHHPPVATQIQRLLQSLADFPERCHLVGAYALGKCQRLMVELRSQGYLDTLYLHGAQRRLCELYETLGIDLGDWALASSVPAAQLAGKIVLCPPSALNDRWSRKLPGVMTCMASGWMQVRARARQRGSECPLQISDHADWPQLLQTLKDVGAPEIWVTHGREEALVHAARQLGFRARALSLLGYEEEAD